MDVPLSSQECDDLIEAIEFHFSECPGVEGFEPDDDGVTDIIEYHDRLEALYSKLRRYA